MVICPRCESPVDETTRTTCPLCFTPIVAAGNAVQSLVPPDPAAPPASYAPQPGAAPLNAAPSGMPGIPAMPTAAPLNAPSGMPGIPAAPLNAPTSAPRMEANQRMTLTGEIIEAPQPMATGPSVGNSQYQARTSHSAPRQPVQEKKSGPNITMIVLIIALLGGGGGGWWFWMHRTNPKEQAQKFLNASKTLDGKAMYQTVEVDSSKVQSEDDYVTTVNSVQTLLPGLKDLLAGIQYQAGEPKYTSMTEATVPVTVKGSISLPGFTGTNAQEINQTISLPMKNFNGIWKVSKDSPYAGGTGGKLMNSFGKSGK